MTTTQTLIVAFAAIGVIAALAIGSIAIRRGGSDGKVGKTDRKAMRRDRAAARAAAPQPAAVAVAHDDGPAPVDPLAEREVLDESSMGVTRRQFFNRGILGIFGLFLAQFGIASLAFMWPKLKPGGFGSKVTAGSAADLFPAVFLPDGRISPLFVPAAQSSLVPFQGDAAGSSFDGALAALRAPRMPGPPVRLVPGFRVPVPRVPLQLSRGVRGWTGSPQPRSLRRLARRLGPVGHRHRSGDPDLAGLGEDDPVPAGPVVHLRGPR
jgi:hypothetical protein